jgi:hypothetical protein
VYVATGIGPPPQPFPSVDTSKMDGQGSIIAFGPPPPAAPRSTRTGDRSFSGTCQLSGHVRFKPAMTNSPQNGRVRVRLRGECSGTLTGGGGRARSISDEAVKSRARSHGLESCAAGRGSGSGYLTFGDHRVQFTYEEVRAGPALTLRAAGASGGSAIVQGNVSPNADPTAITRACGGAGVRRAPVDVRFATTPAISG